MGNYMISGEYVTLLYACAILGISKLLCFILVVVKKRKGLGKDIMLNPIKKFICLM